MPILDVDTPVGPARATILTPTGRPRGLLVLGHGAGGGIDAVDLVAVAGAAVAAGWSAALVEQPWRLAGRKVAAPPKQLDVAWTAVVGVLAATPGRSGGLVVAGRSAGARVACRTAAALAADAVVCLAFPLHPPGRPERSRIAELEGAGVPTLVVQGRRDAFGSPDEIRAALADNAAGVVVQAVDGDHGLKAEPGAVATAVAHWLRSLA
jgi:hypothetical protein